MEQTQTECDELDRLEREVKFSQDPEIRKAARTRYLDLTEKDASK